MFLMTIFDDRAAGRAASPADGDDPTAHGGPIGAATDTIAESRRVRAAAADELAAWAVILHHAA
jgi:hypothetical protein